MAEPSFIYAFDLLGPDRFVELCGLLFGSRFRGFVLGGVGADSGVDAVVDPTLGSWTPETRDALIDEIVTPGATVVFQFKHKVVGRVGESNARQQLLRLYRGKDSELDKPAVKALKPNKYVLVTNVEATYAFREAFIQACRAKNREISSFSMIGLDDLSLWVTLDRKLRAMYFPTLFGPPQFNLRISVMEGEKVLFDNGGRSTRIPMFQVHIANTGTETSYLASMILCALATDGPHNYHIVEPDGQYEPLPPGRSFTQSVPYENLAQLCRHNLREFLPTHVQVVDEVGNIYEGAITGPIRDHIVERVNEEKQ